jgi:triosephosphate isomerase
MRIPLIAGNWKMNTTLSQAVNLVKEMYHQLDAVNEVDRVVCPPFVSLAKISDVIKGSSIKLGAQNMYFEEKGAYTGEISPLMLSELCEYVIIGHSERRNIFHEEGELIDKKVKAALEVGLKPILCIGERLEENEAGRTEGVLSAQLEASSDRSYYHGGMIIAYEPVWAIGTGRAATAEEANKTIGFIRHTIAKKHGEDIALDVRILYGGSVTADNISGLACQPEIDGALVGGASLKADQFITIVKKTAEISGR